MPLTTPPKQIRAVRESVEVTTSRSLTAGDALEHLYSTGSSNYTLTIPVSVFSKDDEIEFAADSTGSLLLTPGSGFSLNGGTATITIPPGKGGYVKFRSPTSARYFGST